MRIEAPMDRASLRFTWLYAGSQLRLKYRYTALGVFWNLLEPLLSLGVLSVVFSYVNRMRLSDYAVFLFSALVPWRYFEKVVSTCTDAIVQGDWLLKTLPASPYSLPLARWMVATIEFVFSFAAVSLILLIVKERWTVHVAIVPLAILPWAVAALGVGLCCATLFTFFRDVRPIVQLALMFAFFTAPILFDPGLFPHDSMQGRLLAWHPVTYLAALFQKPIHAGRWPGPLDWAVSSASAIVALGLGVASIRLTRARLYFYL
jgi:ABC-type polysaccharide/polyol phosphate export permease